MKANHILFSTLAVTLISAYTMSPSEFLKKDFKGRIPASAEEKQEDVKKDEAKKDNVQCKAESKGEKLEKEIKSQTQDIEAILKEINDLKKENKDLKEKVSSKKNQTGQTRRSFSRRYCWYDGRTNFPLHNSNAITNGYADADDEHVLTNAI